MEIHSLSDNELYIICKEYGTKSIIWRKKFIGLLPEVNRRKLHAKKGFSSIFEFAAKLCGLSEEHVRLALNLEKRFEDKPALKELLISGQESINKLSRIVSIATPENEQEIAEKIKLLSIRAVETLVRDQKQSLHVNRTLQPNFQNASCVPAHSSGFSPADDVRAELDELHFRGIDVNELLRAMLKNRREIIEQKKEKLARDLHENAPRYIPVPIKNILKEEYGNKCSIASCKRAAETIHHSRRFALSRNHNPKFLAPLCKDHHIIAHTIDVKFHSIRAVTRQK